MVIKAGTYPGQDNDNIAIGNMSMLCASPDLSEDTVYQITKMLFEKRDDFVTAHKVLEKPFTLENAVSQPELASFHPGALKYYKEKGVIK